MGIYYAHSLSNVHGISFAGGHCAHIITHFVFIVLISYCNLRKVWGCSAESMPMTSGQIHISLPHRRRQNPKYASVYILICCICKSHGKLCRFGSLILKIVLVFRWGRVCVWTTGNSSASVTETSRSVRCWDQCDFSDCLSAWAKY